MTGRGNWTPPKAKIKVGEPQKKVAKYAQNIQQKLDAWIQIFAEKCFKLGTSAISFSASLKSGGFAGSGSSSPMETVVPASAPIFISIRQLSQPGVHLCTEGVIWAPSRQRMCPSDKILYSFRPRRRPSKRIRCPSHR